MKDVIEILHGALFEEMARFSQRVAISERLLEIGDVRGSQMFRDLDRAWGGLVHNRSLVEAHMQGTGKRVPVEVYFEPMVFGRRITHQIITAGRAPYMLPQSLSL